MIRFCSLGSGSTGNATVVEATGGITTTRLLIDAGFSLRELELRLERAGLAPNDLDEMVSSLVISAGGLDVSQRLFGEDTTDPLSALGDLIDVRLMGRTERGEPLRRERDLLSEQRAEDAGRVARAGECRDRRVDVSVEDEEGGT